MQKYKVSSARSPSVLYTQDDRVFLYHSSFSDFIFTDALSNFYMAGKKFTFSCNKATYHSLLCESYFSIMSNRPSSFLSDRDNTVELSEQVNQNISAVLRWTHHLPSPQLINTYNICRCILEFIQIRVLI